MSEQIHLVYPALGRMFFHLRGGLHAKMAMIRRVSKQHPHPQHPHAYSPDLSPLVYTMELNMDLVVFSPWS